MVKSPAFQFYPADWLNDIKLQSCSLAAQGLLLNLMCLMHQSENYGFLLINGVIPSVKDVSHLLRLHHKTYQARLKELFLKGVLYEDENKAICCKRMIKDEHIREVRRKSGKLGGNPLLKQDVKQDSKQKSTPSSSTSPSSSVNDLLSKDNKSRSGDHFKNKVGDYLDVILAEIELINKFPQNGKPLNQRTLFQWLQKKSNSNGHPKALFKSLSWLRTNLEKGEDIKSFRAFVEATFQTVNPKYHGRDSEAESEVFKNVVIEDERIKEILKGIG